MNICALFNLVFNTKFFFYPIQIEPKLNFYYVSIEIFGPLTNLITALICFLSFLCFIPHFKHSPLPHRFPRESRGNRNTAKGVIQSHKRQIYTYIPPVPWVKCNSSAASVPHRVMDWGVDVVSFGWSLSGCSRDGRDWVRPTVTLSSALAGVKPPMCRVRESTLSQKNHRTLNSVRQWNG